MRHGLLVPTLGFASMMIAAVSCTDDAISTPGGKPEADAATVSPTPPTPPTLDLARAPRHPVGQTLVLPAGSYALEAAPNGNQNQVFVENGRSLFVPHVAGTYTFSDGSRRFEAGVVAADTLAFHNVNHYPTRAIERAADGALWVVATLTPELLRVDEATLSVTDRVPVGAWPVAVRAVPSKGAVLVANRGEDTLSWVDTSARRVVRSIYVGDEVSNVDVTSDGRTALALLPTDGAVALVDLETKTVRARVPVGIDPTYVAITKDGRRAFVAGRRTGEEKGGRDLVEIDIEKAAVTRSVEDVGTTIGGLTLSEDETALYVATLRNDPRASLANPAGGSFRHHIVVYDLAGAAIVEQRAKDVTLSAAPAGAPASLANARVASLHAPLIVGDSVWVLSEANDMAVRFSLDTLEERERVAVGGRPRSLFRSQSGKTYGFGHQSLALTELDTGRSAPVAADPRQASVARGQRFFTGVGAFLPAGPPGSGLAIAGDRWSCNSCHVDGASDKLVWQAGPIQAHRYASRPYVLLEATWPLGWQGYLSSVRNYAVTVTGNVGINDPSTEDATALSEYLSSIMPPGRANSLTERDGSLSPQARKGYPVFERVCAGCHAGPLGTSRRRIDKSIGDGKVADIPALVGVYRQGVFFRDGSAKTLDAAVEQMVTFAKESLDTAELAALKRYVAEMTSRELFATSASPQPGAPLALDGSLVVTFSYPIYANDENVDKVRLFAVDDAGTARRLLAKATVDGRRVTLAPVDRLPPASKLRLTIEAGLEAEDGRLVATSTTTEYRTASVATLALDGRYTLTYTPVAFGPPGTPVAPLTATIVANKGPSGSSDIEVSFPSKQIRFTTKAVVSGTRLHVPPIPLAVSGAFADGFSGFEADLLDTNGDGIADGVAGGTGPAGARGYTMSGPGFEAPSLAWDLVRLP